MAVRILHAADFHMDSPFDSLTEAQAIERRKEQRNVLENLAEIAAVERAQIVLLSGDLFDSATCYWETQEALFKMLSDIKAEIFIAPGNHDYYCPKAPYSYLGLPENVHIFTSPTIRCIKLPELNVRVWGAGFIAPQCAPILQGFTVPDDEPNMTDIMVLHGTIGGSTYAPMTEAEIAASGLDYLALGHVHTYSGVQKAGQTHFAYPGCIQGRGFDETGAKGVIVGEVSKKSVDLRFVPIPGRRYIVTEFDLTGKDAALAAILDALANSYSENAVKLILTGEYNGEINTTAIETALHDKFYHITVKNHTHPVYDIWSEMDNDSLTGLFLTYMKARYDSAEDADKESILTAVRYGLAALEGREGWRP